MLTPLSSIPGVIWPALPNANAAALLSVLFQLEQSQWLSADELDQLQRKQLSNVIEHAYRTVPFYRERFDQAGLDPLRASDSDRWRQLPLLARRDVQTLGESLASIDIPKSHGQISTVSSSGSTGVPVTVKGTEVTQFIWRLLTLRDHVWHRRDLSQPFAAIRYMHADVARYPHGEQSDNWGPATRGVVATGPASLLNVQSSLDEQAEWLQRIDPVYILTYPSVLSALAQHFQKHGQSLPKLREARTFGEIVEPSCHEACKTAWGVRVVDMYSSQETGYLALQCPESSVYHIQSEAVLVEILDETGKPCGPGEIGRVVITSLHNFAMPLIRYDIGDYAEVGGPCPCGRGLPVLKRIVGRQRNMFLLPDGRRVWPNLAPMPEEIAAMPPLQQFQVVQRTLGSVELLIVAPRRFTVDEEQLLRNLIDRAIGCTLDLKLSYVPEIPRGASGKYEDFRSEVKAMDVQGS